MVQGRLRQFVRICISLFASPTLLDVAWLEERRGKHVARRERHGENEQKLGKLACKGQKTPRKDRPRGTQKDPAATERNCSCNRRMICLYAFFDLFEYHGQGQQQDAAAARSCRRRLTHGDRDRQSHGDQIQEQDVCRLRKQSDESTISRRRKTTMEQDRQSANVPHLGLRSSAMCLRSCLDLRSSAVCPRSSCACVSPSRTRPSLTLGSSGLMSAAGFGASEFSYSLYACGFSISGHT